MRDIDFRLDDCVAVVTGAARGIGQSIALHLARAGAHVAALDIDLEGVQQVAGEIQAIGRKAMAARCDLRKANEIADVVEGVLAEFRQIDILVNNAGICLRQKALDVSEDAWDATLDVNLKAAFFASQAVGRHMVSRRSGRIINIASQLASVAMPEHASYCASKAGVILLTKVLATEWGQYGINVNAIAPAFVKTEMSTHIYEDPAKLQSILSRLAVGRVGVPEDVAGAVVYLASPASGFVTGTTLFVDGGWVAW